MTPIVIISVAAFVAVVALILAVMFLLGDFGKTKAEERLQVLVTPTHEGAETSGLLKQPAFREGVEGFTGLVQGWLARLNSLNDLFEQANSPISANTFFVVTLICAVLGAAVAVILKAPLPLYPLGALAGSSVPFFWLLVRRRRRLNRFARQLPEALELVGRALRAGHGLVSGMRCVADEMLDPVASEFAYVCESQTLGMSLEQSLNDMLRRMPNRDLEFFVTAVIMQKQLGGNLAEILQKIAYIVRERFKILGQVHALTGEGRISGAVLMVLPVILFATVYHLNPEYVMILFNDVTGRKMLAVAIVLQLVGALSIKKIVDIKI